VSGPADRFADARAALVELVRERAAADLPVPHLSERVAAALLRVPRHAFVRAEDVDRAYHDRPLAIGHGQTISQPTVVAMMTELARPGPDDTVLEVGTGCGYQTAVLAELARHVFSIELVPELARDAAARLARLGYANVTVRQGDGWEGWPEHAPYAAIVVTAGAAEVPPPLVEQLAPEGRLVIPVDAGGFGQELLLLEKDAHGLRRRSVAPVAFVPLRRGALTARGAGST
jgi:protein-L-isoaspartate(D-aspartate) O-methyltransferase